MVTDGAGSRFHLNCGVYDVETFRKQMLNGVCEAGPVSLVSQKTLPFNSSHHGEPFSVADYEMMT